MMNLVEELRGYELQDREFLDDINTSVNKRAADRIEELEKQLADAKVDAERYRWLAGEAESIQGRLIEWETCGGDYGIPDPTLATAIDAAMKESKE